MKQLTLALMFASAPCFASDHIDGPVTKSNSVSDLTDLYSFPTPDKPGSLSVVLNTYPLVGASGHFSDKVTYNFVLRRAQIAGEGDKSHIDTNDEVQISCTFDTASASSAKHTVACKSSNGLAASNTYNKVSEKAPGDDFRVYAGMRADPFFFNLKFSQALSGKGKINPPKDNNIMNHANVLSIALDLDLKTLFKGNPPAMVAVAATSTTKDTPGSPPRQLDRLGRPEITNVSMVAHDEPDLRDEYNLDRPFQVAPAQQKKYVDRLAKNIAFYDAADGKKDWADNDRIHLAGVLGDDFLVVDTSKPCKDGDFLEIEKALVANKPHQTCGGRRPNDDIMTTLYTSYVNNDKGDKIRNGVDHPYRAVPKDFPYLADPDLSLQGRSAVLIKKTLAELADLWGIEAAKLKKLIHGGNASPDEAAPEPESGTAPAN